MPPGAKTRIGSLKKGMRQALGLDFSMRPQLERSMSVLGSDYGAHAVCLDGLGKDSVVYSFGLGEDVTFDLELIQKTGVKVFGFDPTPRSLEWLGAQALPREFSVHPWGLAAYDGEACFAPPENPAHISHTLLSRPGSEARAITVEVRRLQSIMREFGHQTLDVLKLDIEGAEYEVLDELLTREIPARQLLLEFHHQFRDIPVARTRRAIAALNQQGFLVTYVSDSGREVSLQRAAS